MKASDPSNRNSRITQESGHDVYDSVRNQRWPSAPRMSLPPRMCPNREPFSRSDHQLYRNHGSELAARPRLPLKDELLLGSTKPALTESSELHPSPVNISNTPKAEDTERRNTIAFFNRMMIDGSLREKLRSEARGSNFMQTLTNNERREENSVDPDPHQLVCEPPLKFPVGFYESHALPAEADAAHSGVQTTYETTYDQPVYYSWPYQCYPPDMQVLAPIFPYQDYQFLMAGPPIGLNYPDDGGNAAATDFDFQSAPPDFLAPQFSASTAIPSTSYYLAPTSYTPYPSQSTAPPGFDALKPLKPLEPPISLKPLKPLQPETVTGSEVKGCQEQVAEDTLQKYVGIKSDESVAKDKTNEKVKRLLLARRNIDSKLLEVLHSVASSEYRSDEASRTLDEFSKALTIALSGFEPASVSAPTPAVLETDNKFN